MIGHLTVRVTAKVIPVDDSCEKLEEASPVAIVEIDM
jgi:hypothetical protein